MGQGIRSILTFLLLGSMLRSSLSQQKNPLKDESYEYLERYGTQMLSYMNLLVQPCDDFYEYACGNWKNTIEVRQSEKRRVNLYETAYKLNDIIDDILQRRDIEDVAPELGEDFKEVQKMYHQCLKADLYPMRKSPEYLEIIRNIGGFPALDPLWNSSQFNWVRMSGHLSNYGVDNLIKEKQFPLYPFEPYLDLPHFGFDIELRYDTIANASTIEYQLNRERMHRILSVYGVAEDAIERTISDIFVFLKSILTIMEQFGESDFKCKRMQVSVDEWDELSLLVDLSTYYEIAWKGTYVLGNRKSRPCVYFYLELIRSVEEHTEAVANYLALKFLYHMDARLDDSKFQKDYCISSLKNALIFFFDHLYMKVSEDKISFEKSYNL